MTSKYKINKKDIEQTPNLWDAEAETLIALLAKRISKIRQLDMFYVCKELNYKYLRKRIKGKFKNYAATQLQRVILKDIGY